MATVEFKLTYDSGETVTVNPSRPRALLEFERHWGVSQPEEGSAHQNEQLLWLTWAALGKPGDDFDTWVDTVAAFEVPRMAELMEELGSNGAAPKAKSRSGSPKRRSRAT